MIALKIKICIKDHKWAKNQKQITALIVIK